MQMGSMTPVHVLIFPAAILVGIGGGLLGVAFSVLNIWIVKKRTHLINSVRRPAAKKFLRMLEPVVIMVSVVNGLVIKTDAGTMHCTVTAFFFLFARQLL